MLLELCTTPFLTPPEGFHTMKRRFRSLGFVLLILLSANTSIAMADVGLPKVFADHMVLQRNMEIPVWGWADPGEDVVVTLGDGVKDATKADEQGKWMVRLPAQEAGGPVTLTVQGNNEVTFEDVLIGEVWVCSGQSNMEWPVAACDNAEQEIANADFPRVRQIKVKRVPQSFPQNDVELDFAWSVTTPETVGRFTAVGYFFGRYLHQELDVPIGLINTSWGGTRIEPWTPVCGFADVPALESILKKVRLTDPANEEYQSELQDYLTSLDAWIKSAKTSLADESPISPPPTYPSQLQPLTSHGDPTTLYNGMVHALVPFAMRGAIWYQGESNHVEGMLYYEKMKALIQGWREVWNEGEFPFLFVQIAPYRYGDESPGILPVFWEAQAKSLDIPNTGMAVVHDIGNLDDIHPRNKQDVGKRLALIALAKTYGQENVVYSGPTFKSMEIEGNRIRIKFDHVGSGLTTNDGQAPDWFEMIGEETDFVKPIAVIDGDSVVLSSPEVKKPAAVRFAWHKLAEPNLANKEGLPAVPFRAGEVPQRDWLKLKVKEAADYQLVYDLNLENLGADIKYDVNRADAVNDKFERIAYFLELQKNAGPTSYVYVSMDAFTDDVTKIAIPTAKSHAMFQQRVQNMNVISNVDGIQQGTGLPGNIEFWPHNYGATNAANVPNASGSVYDFGDDPGAPVDGYGCMQVHNYEAQQTLFAINKWKATPDIGIGNSTGNTRDWTFKSNASEYTVKRLRVLVK
jgi:sialate O-acetylesterase